MMEEVICRGTPAEIAEAITVQRARLGFFVEQSGEGALIYIVSHSSDEGPYLLHIHLPFALIGPAPDGQSLLTSHAEGHPKPTQWWDFLISELRRLGWLATILKPAQAERAEARRHMKPDNTPSNSGSSLIRASGLIAGSYSTRWSTSIRIPFMPTPCAPPTSGPIRSPT